MKNRNIFSRMEIFFLVALFAVLFAVKADAQRIDIETSRSTRQILRVQTILEGRGVVMPKEEKTLRMSVDARFHYDERVIARASQLKSIRSYKQALAKIRLDGKPIVNRLSSDKSIIISQTKGADLPIQMASLGGPISQNEFELVNTPGNTLILGEIFTKRSVKTGDTWNPNKKILGRFLNIDSIEETDVLIELVSVKDKIATLVIAGETNGTIDGASTVLSLNGNARFDTAAGNVVHASITISQQRDIGLMAPGLDATFKMITKIQPVSDSEHLSDQGLANLRKNSGRITDDLLLTPDSSPISLLHPRDWRVIADHSTRTILRYNWRGRMIGQCDIIPLPDRMPDQEQTLDQFKAVVKNSLANNSAEIEGADRSTTRHGLEWLRVDASGTDNGVNLLWTYFTITHKDGRRVQLVFTTEPANAASFSGKEDCLIDSMHFNTIEKTPSKNAGYKSSDSD